MNNDNDCEIDECVDCGNDEFFIEYGNLCELCYIQQNPQLDITINIKCNTCNIQLLKDQFIRICGTEPRDLCRECYDTEQKREEYKREEYNKYYDMIKNERKWVDKKPYSHNIISMYLQIIDELDIEDLSAEKVIKKLKLDLLGW